MVVSAKENGLNNWDKNKLPCILNLFHIKYICEHIVWSWHPDDPPSHLLKVPDVVPGSLPDYIHLGFLPQAGCGRHIPSGGEGRDPPSGAPGPRETGAVHTWSSEEKKSSSSLDRLGSDVLIEIFGIFDLAFGYNRSSENAYCFFIVLFVW